MKQSLAYTFLIILCMIGVASCANRNGKGEHYIQDVIVSNFAVSGDLFSMDVEAILNGPVQEEFYEFHKGDLSFSSSGTEDPSSVIFQLKDKDGFVLESGCIDGPGVKRITFPYKNIPVKDNGVVLIATMTIYGRKVDTMVVPLELSQERLSAVEVQSETSSEQTEKDDNTTRYWEDYSTDEQQAFLKSNVADKNILELFMPEDEVYGDYDEVWDALKYLVGHQYGNNAGSILDAYYFHCLDLVISGADGALADGIGSYCWDILRNATAYSVGYCKSHPRFREKMVDHIGFEMYCSMNPEADYGELTEILGNYSDFADSFVADVRSIVYDIENP